MVDPILVFSEGLRLRGMQQSIDRQLFLRTSFELIDGLTTIERVEISTTYRVFLNSILYSLVLSYVVSGLLEFNQYLNRREGEAVDAAGKRD